MKPDMVKILKDSDNKGDIKLVLSDRPDQSFRLCFPEVIWRHTESGRPVQSGRTFEEVLRDYKVFWKKEPSYSGTEWKIDAKGSFRRSIEFAGGSVQAGIFPFDEGVKLELPINNNSETSWMDCYAEVCLQLSGSPDFADTARERTYGRIKGEWKALSSTPAGRPDSRRNTYYATPQNAFLWEMLRGWWTEAIDVTLDHPMIFVQSRAGDGIVGIEFEHPIGYCNNLSFGMACIHSDPYLGNIPPGGKAHAAGRILYCRKSREAFLSELKK